jgi:hypothetical protein
MRGISKLLALSAAMTFGVIHGCVYPTDDSAQLQVVMNPIPDMLEGEIIRLSGFVLDADGERVPNVEVTFASDNAQVAVVSEENDMLATGPGVTTLVASALGFNGAEPATAQVKIHNMVEIDSVRPRIVRFGDSVHLYGAGLNPEPFGPGNEFIGVFLGNADAKPKSYLPENADAPNRFGRLTVWVAPPTPPLSFVAVLGVNGLAINETDTLRTFQFDIYEPNDTIPWDFGPVQSIIRNPALAFEKRLRGDSVGGDWYRFEQTAVGDKTIIIRSDQVGPDSYQLLLTNSLAWNGAAVDFELGPGAWTVGRSFYTCQGLPLAVPQLPPDSSMIALRNLPVGTYDFIAAFSQPGAYEMAVLPSYRSELPPDNAEENDYCDVAKPLVLGQSRDLTIDNPSDVDWFKFSLADSTDVAVDLNATDPEADLDVYVLQDFLPDSLPLKALSQIGGATDGAAATVGPGDYFLVVVDFAGVPTEYTLASSATATAVPLISNTSFPPGLEPRAPMLLRTNR